MEKLPALENVNVHPHPLGFRMTKHAIIARIEAMHKPQMTAA